MNSYQRVMARLEGKTVDRVPNHCIIMQFAAKYIGVSYNRYVTEYKVLCEGVLRVCEDFGIDMLSVISDPMREAAGFGAHVIIPEDNVPYTPNPLISNWGDLKCLHPIDPSIAKRMNDRLEAVAIPCRLKY